MRPFPGKLLSVEKKIFNYRLCRGRRIIENSFGILVARWRILKQTINLFPDNVEKIVLATIALHNFIMRNDTNAKYCPANYVDTEDKEKNIIRGNWRLETDTLSSARLGSNNGPQVAFNLRDKLMEYFCTDGCVLFQYDRI